MPEVFRCRRCGFRSVRPFRFLGHLLRHAAKDQLSRCSRCQRKLFSPRHKRLHRLRCLGAGRRQTLLQSPSARKKERTYEERQGQERDVLSCPHCPFETRQGAYSLTKHLRRPKACERRRKMASFTNVKADWDGKFPCSKCSYRGMSLVLLNNHMRRPKACQMQKIPCAKCSYEARDLAALTKHCRSTFACLRQQAADRSVKVQRDADGKLPCPGCPFRARDPYTLTKHLEHGTACARRNGLSAPPPGQPGLSCSGSVFRALDGTVLRRHRSSCKAQSEPKVAPDEDGVFACPKCPYRAAERSLLSGHIESGAACARQLLMSQFTRQDEGDGKLACPDCPYRAADSATLATHRKRRNACHKMRVMSEWAGYEEEGGEYPCPRCPYRARLPQAVHKHLSSKVACERHIAISKTAEYRDESGIFSCPRCPYMARLGNDLARHLNGKRACQLQLQAEEKAHAAPKLQKNTDDATDPKVNLERNCRGQDCDFASSQEEEMKAHETLCEAALLKSHEVELLSDSGGLCECGYDSLGQGRRKVLAHFYGRTECHISRAAALVKEKAETVVCPHCAWTPRSGHGSDVNKLIVHLRTRQGCRASVLDESETEMGKCDECGVELSSAWKLARHAGSSLGCRLILSGLINQTVLSLWASNIGLDHMGSASQVKKLSKTVEGASQLMPACRGLECNFTDESGEAVAVHEAGCVGVLAQRHWDELFPGGPVDCAQCSRPACVRKLFHLQHFYSAKACRAARLARDVVKRSKSETCPECSSSFVVGDEPSSRGTIRLIAHFTLTACGRALAAREPDPAKCADCGAEMEGEEKLAVHRASELGCRLVASGALTDYRLESSGACDDCFETLPVKALTWHSCIQNQRKKQSKSGRTATKREELPKPALKPLSCQGLECNYAVESEEEVALHEAGCVGVLAQRHWDELFPGGPLDCAQCSRPAPHRKLFHLQHFYNPLHCRMARVTRTVFQSSEEPCCPFCEKPFRGHESERLFRHLTTSLCGRELMSQEEPPEQCPDCGAEVEGREALAKHRASAFGCQLIAAGALAPRALRPDATCDTCLQGVSAKALPTHACVKLARCEPVPRMTSIRKVPAPVKRIQHVAPKSQCSGMECKFAGESEEEVKLHEASCVGVLAQQHWTELFGVSSAECAQCSRSLSTRRRLQLKHFYTPILCRMAKVARDLLGDSEEATCPECSTLFTLGNATKTSVESSLIAHLSSSLCGRALMAQAEEPPQCPDCGAAVEGEASLARHRASTVACRLISSGFLGKRVEALPRPDAPPPPAKCSGLGCDFAEDGPEAVQRHEASCLGVLARRHWEELFPEGARDCGDCARPPSFRRLLQLQHFYTPSICRAARVVGEAVRTPGRAACPLCDASLEGAERMALSHLSKGACMRALAERGGPPLECSSCGAKVEGGAKLRKHLDSSLGCRLIASGFLDSREAKDQSVVCDSCSQLLPFKALKSHPCIGQALGKTPVKRLKADRPETGREAFDCSGCMRTFKGRQSIVRHHCDKLQPLSLLAQRASAALLGSGRKCPLCRLRAPATATHAAKLRHIASAKCRQRSALAKLFVQADASVSCPSCGAPAESPSALESHFSSSQPCRKAFVDSLWADGKRSCGCGFASASAESLALHAASELACEAQRRGLFKAPSQPVL